MESRQMTISVGIFNGKGGVTKSTIARALAVAYAKAGWNVCLIDMDVLNGTVTRWVQRRMANNIEPAIAAQPCGTPSQVQKIIESEVYDLVIVDGGAYASESVPKLSEFLYQSRKFAWCFPARLKTKLTILKPKSTWLIRHTLLLISTFPTSQL